MSLNSTCSASQMRRRLWIETSRAVSDSAWFERRRATTDIGVPGKHRTQGRQSLALKVTRLRPACPERWQIALLLLLACAAGQAGAQAVPALRYGPQMAVFAKGPKWGFCASSTF